MDVLEGKPQMIYLNRINPGQISDPQELAFMRVTRIEDLTAADSPPGSAKIVYSGKQFSATRSIFSGSTYSGKLVFRDEIVLDIRFKNGKKLKANFDCLSSQ